MPTPVSVLAATVVVVVTGLAAFAQIPPPPGEPAVVETVRPLGVRGDRPAWSVQGDAIAYDRVDGLGFSRLYVADPDGTAARCLTCEPLDFRKLHAGNAAWHPSGDYLVFQVEHPVREADTPLPFRAVPGGNRGDEDLWAITRDGRQFWNLTHRGDRGVRFATPRFAREGDLLLWSERLGSGGGAWGRWALQVARFEPLRGIPRLKGVDSSEPGPQRLYLETCDFTADDNGALFAANLEPGQAESGLDLYVLDLRSGAVRRLTRTPDELDRHARLSPNGRWIAWASTRGIPERPAVIPRAGRAAAVTDLWLMPFDRVAGEASALRLTHFSDVFSDRYVGKMTAGPPAWSPDGDRLIVPVAPVDRPRDSELYLVTLSSPLGR